MSGSSPCAPDEPDPSTGSDAFIGPSAPDEAETSRSHPEVAHGGWSIRPHHEAEAISPNPMGPVGRVRGKAE